MQKEYRAVLYSYLIWWGIGAGIGLLFSMAVDGEMKQTLAVYLQNEITVFSDQNINSFTYFLKRSLCYTQLLLMIWCMECFVFGHIGVRIVMLIRGFIYGFSQTFWVLSCGAKGIFLGLITYLPQNIVLVAGLVLIELILYRSVQEKSNKMRKVGILVGIMVPVAAWAEAYGAQALFLTFM